jgi:hypothetical protein
VTLARSPQTEAAGHAALRRCLDPVKAGEFLSEYWERRPLSVPRAEPGRFDDLLSEGDVERLVCGGGLRYPAFRLVKAGEQFDVSAYTVDLPWRPVPFSGTADVERVVAEFDGGATIVLQGLHLTWTPLARVCRALEAVLGHPVQANAYYTPRHSQGLGVHHDTHDVLVLQVAGEKRWLVYEPAVELPLREQRYRDEFGGPGQVVEDLVLQPGDTLYLPRGWLHEALTSESDSLHLTIGVNVDTWLDAVKAALDECRDEVAFRRAVDADGRTEDDLLGLLAERLEPEEVARRRRERFLRMRRPIREDALTQLRALDGLGVETLVERRETTLAELRAEGDSLCVAFEGKELRLPARVREEVEFCVDAAEPFTPADLPGSLDANGRVVLVRRFVREGLLRVSELGLRLEGA